MQSPDFMSGAYEPTQQPDNIDIDRIFGTYKPQTDANDALMQMIKNFPQREEPGRMRSIAGFLAGLGAGVHPAGMGDSQPQGFVGGNPQEINAAQELAMYPKFHQQMGDWGAKIKPVETAAANERMFNQNERMNVNNYAARSIAADRAANYAKEIESKGEARKAGTQIKYLQTQINAAAEARKNWQMNHPNHVIKQDEKGYLIGVDPRTDQYVRIRDSEGSPVKGNALPDATKIEKVHTNRMLEIDEMGAQRLLNTKEQGNQTRQNIATRGTTNPSDTQERARIRNAMTKAVIQHPEWESYFDFNTGKVVYTGTDSEEQKAIEQAVFPPSPIRLPPSNSPTATPTATPTPNQKPQGQPFTMKDSTGQIRYKVTGPNGETGTVNEQDSKRLPQGWSLVYK